MILLGLAAYFVESGLKTCQSFGRNVIEGLDIERRTGVRSARARRSLALSGGMSKPLFYCPILPLCREHMNSYMCIRAALGQPSTNTCAHSLASVSVLYFSVLQRG